MDGNNQSIADTEEVIVVGSRPVNSAEDKLRDKFIEAIAEQSALMDKLAQQLLTLSLAIPGLYATVLKFTQGADATVTAGGWLYLTYGLWALALIFALLALFPRDYQVDPAMLKSDPTGKSKKLSIEEFFRKSAVYKRWRLIISALCLFAGIVCAALLIF